MQWYKNMLANIHKRLSGRCYWYINIRNTMTVERQKRRKHQTVNYAKTHYENNETDMTRKAAGRSTVSKDVNDEKPPKWYRRDFVGMAKVSS
jgi:hypothetical protein